MSRTPWFHERLSNSMAEFAWAVEHIPTERWHSSPKKPDWLGTWSLARHVFHMQYHERYVVLADLKEMLRLPPDPEERPNEEQTWRQEQSTVPELLQCFQAARRQTLELISGLNDDQWDIAIEETYWRTPWSIEALVTKAWQHTLEHTHDVLRLHLFWDAATYQESHPEDVPG